MKKAILTTIILILGYTLSFSAELSSGTGSGYPAVIDTDTQKESADTIAHWYTPNDLADAIIKVQVELGINPAGSYDTVRERFENVLSTTGVYLEISTHTKIMGNLDVIENSKIFKVIPNQVESSELPASVLLQSLGSSLSIMADGEGTAGSQFTLLYRDTALSLWRSALKIEHTAGFGDLILMKSGGNVGISTTTPSEKLEVAGNIKSHYGIIASTLVVSGAITNIVGALTDDTITVDDLAHNIDARPIAFYASTAAYADDSNLLDGLDSTAFAQLSATQTFTGQNTFTNQVTISSNTSISGDLTVNKKLIFGDVPSQNLETGSTILSADSYYVISSTSDIVMTATPTIADGTGGQWLILSNTGTFFIDIQDDAVLAGSKMFYGGSSAVIAPKDTISLLFDPVIDGWIIQSHPNLQVAGANADVIPVRNNSGTTIPALSVVYASGYNVGQHRILIDLADADDSAKMPAIGITPDSIPDGSNGVVVISGIIEANLSAYSLYDTLYASTTAGGLTNVRPTVDEIQALAIVTRAHTQGSMIVIGAGRTNDVPINFTANSVTVTVMGVSRIDWADGTVQVSSPTAAVGNGGQPDIKFSYMGDVFNSTSPWKFNPITSAYAFTTARYDIDIGSATTNNPTIAFAKKSFGGTYSVFETAVIPVGVSSHTFVGSNVSILDGDIVIWGFFNVSASDPIGNVTAIIRD